jgi:endonuclease III
MMTVRGRREPFEIGEVLERISEAIQPYPKAAMFELAERGYDSPFEQLVACIISIRTYDETSIPVSERLFALARTPAEMVKLSVAEIDAAIRESTFHENKAPQILAIAQQILDEHGGELPCDFDVLTSFKGVGPKCANLTLGIACGLPSISVDVHVHRVANRWGYVATNSPEQTLRALEQQLPEAHWIEINKLLVPFGKHICTGRRPKCSTCPVETMCAQVGVENPR